jgi:hypothetical protein
VRFPRKHAETILNGEAEPGSARLKTIGLNLEQRWIAEIDVNPLLTSPEQALAIDARVDFPTCERFAMKSFSQSETRTGYPIKAIQSRTWFIDLQ